MERAHEAGRAIRRHQGPSGEGTVAPAHSGRVPHFTAGHSGVGTAGGFTFILQDRSGRDLQFISDNLNKFLEAARKRPELASLSTTFLPVVPQVFVNVDRDKALKQGVDLGEVYRTLQAFMGGSFINYF